MIGGRAFLAADLSRRTVRHDHFLTSAIAAAGCDRLEPLPGDNDHIFLVRMFGQMLASGQACRVLAAFLLPIGTTEKQWSPELAAEIQAHLEQCDTEADRQIVQAATMQAARGFFLRGLTLLANSPNSTESDGESSARPVQS